MLGAWFAKSVCKILMSKILEVKILRTEGLEVANEARPEYARLGHDYANEEVGARLDVTLGAVG